MGSTATKVAEAELQKAFSACRAEGKSIRVPDYQVDPGVYAVMKKHFLKNRGKWNTKSQSFDFEFEAKILLTRLQSGERPNFYQSSHYFPTPRAVVNEMCNMLILEDGHRILEPSAGRGAIIEGVNEFICVENPHQWVVIESDPVNRSFLEEKGFPAIHDDFDTWVTDERFEMCYANPPFNRATEHVGKIAHLLAPGGSAVIVLPSSWPYAPKANVDLMRRFEVEFESVSVRKLPSSAFKESGTNANTVLLGLLYKKA